MKNRITLFLGIALIAVASTVLADCDSCNNDCSTNDSDCDNCCVKTTYEPRSQGDRLNDQATYYNYQYGNDCFYGGFKVEYSFQQTFRDERIARSLFGCDTLVWTGSAVTPRGAPQLLADDFGLARQDNISFTFHPRIQNHIINFELYLGLNELVDGLWMQFDLPLVHSKWDLCHNDCDNCDSCDSCDNDCNDGCNGCGNATTMTPGTTAVTPDQTLNATPFPAGYMALISETTKNAPLTTLRQALTGTAFGDSDAWQYGKFCGCDKDDTDLAAVNFRLGYNFYECPDYHIGIFFKVDAPTGTKRDCCLNTCIFNPKIGKDFWGVGGGLTGHAELYNCDDDHVFTAYIEGYAEHLCSRTQARSFDFKNLGILSRYLLLKEYNADGTYKGLTNAINYTTRRADVSVDVMGEGIFELIYKNSCGLSVGLGYNIYGRSKEEICNTCTPCVDNIDSRFFGIKGCSPVDAQGYVVAAGVLQNPAIAIDQTINASQSNATINGCGTVDHPQTLQNITGTGPAAAGFIYVDPELSPAVVPGTTLLTAVTPVQVSSTTVPTISPNTGIITVGTLTNSEVQLSPSDLDTNSAATCSQLSNKIFGHIDYAWTDCDWTPYLRLGAEVELTSHEYNGTPNAWAVSILGGVSF